MRGLWSGRYSWAALHGQLRGILAWGAECRQSRWSPLGPRVGSPRDAACPRLFPLLVVAVGDPQTVAVLVLAWTEIDLGSCGAAREAAQGEDQLLRPIACRQGVVDVRLPFLDQTAQGHVERHQSPLGPLFDDAGHLPDVALGEEIADMGRREHELEGRDQTLSTCPRDQPLGEDAGQVLGQTLPHLHVLLGSVEREEARDRLRRVAG